jgi:hypothetical protein
MTSQQEAARRLRLALDLFETGVAIMEQNLRREHPQATEEEIQEKLFQWLRHRPGAEDGDAPGRRVSWPRPQR